MSLRFNIVIQCPYCRSETDVTFVRTLRDEGDKRYEQWYCLKCGGWFVVKLSWDANRLEVVVSNSL